MTPDWTEIVECRETFDNLTSCWIEIVEYLRNIQQFGPAVKKKRECIRHPRFFYGIGIYKIFLTQKCITVGVSQVCKMFHASKMMSSFTG